MKIWEATAEVIACTMEDYLDWSDALEDGTIPDDWPDNWEKIVENNPEF